ncbi:calcium/calmodulin-dependent protein kinase type 1 [Selaginella moellendorffii]|nr:calcium/calmodulin-dependent protein kinase type 1 [Selaginella moellendorffii]|eukprot:XP_002984502.2 calcium/calmodulin-dependent protein kinase type 1 [Selaginella moellendorffii]
MTIWREVESGKVVELPALKKLYRVVMELGSGGQGTVHLVMGSKLLAAKSLPETAQRELRVMLKLAGCQGTIQLYDVVLEEDRKFKGGRWWGTLILELGSCTLSERLHKAGGKMEEQEAAFVIKSLAEALGRVHSLGVVHRDVKLDNVLLTRLLPPYEVKLADFGLATDVAEDMHENCGTNGYISPDVLRAGKDGWPFYYTKAVDLWGLGLIAYELVTGWGVFSDVFDVECFLKSAGDAEVERALKWGGGVSKEARELILGMLKVNPEQRLTVEEVLRHPWVVENTGPIEKKQKTL